MLLLDTGAKIKRARRIAGMTQEELSSALDINSVTISRWETGKQLPGYSTMWRISEILGVPLSDLLEDGKDGIEDSLHLSHGKRHRKSNVAANLERIFSDLARLNPDIIVMVHEIAEAWDGMDDAKRHILLDGLSFVLGNFSSSQIKKTRQDR